MAEAKSFEINGIDVFVKDEYARNQLDNIAKQIEQGGTGTIPDNVVCFQEVEVDETTETQYPFFSANGTAYILTINDSGIPVVKDINGNIIFTCGTGGSSSGGDSGNTGDGDNTGDAETIISGTPYTLEWTDGIYISETNGKEVSSTSWSATQYLSLVGADYIEICKASSTYNKYCAFYDINKNYVSQLHISDNGINRIEIPSNAVYFRISCAMETKEDYSIKSYVLPSPTWSDGVAYDLGLIADKYIIANGIITDYANWSMTDYLDCVRASKLSIINPTIGTNYCCFLDINKTSISGATVAITTDSPVEITVPQFACYFVMSNTTEAMNNVTITPYAS